MSELLEKEGLHLPQSDLNASLDPRLMTIPSGLHLPVELRSADGTVAGVLRLDSVSSDGLSDAVLYLVDRPAALIADETLYRRVRWKESPTKEIAIDEPIARIESARIVI